MIFVDAERAQSIRQDQIDCKGCLSHCLFSNWADNEQHRTGRKADPRSFCIQKTLQEIAHNADVDKELMFAGHNAWRFAEDPFYRGGFIPSVPPARLAPADRRLAPVGPAALRRPPIVSPAARAPAGAYCVRGPDCDGGGHGSCPTT